MIDIFDFAVHDIIFRQKLNAVYYCHKIIVIVVKLLAFSNLFDKSLLNKYLKIKYSFSLQTLDICFHRSADHTLK